MEGEHQVTPMFKGLPYSSDCFDENRVLRGKSGGEKSVRRLLHNSDERRHCLGSGFSNVVHKKWSDFIHILKVEPTEVIFEQRRGCKK